MSCLPRFYHRFSLLPVSTSVCISSPKLPDPAFLRPRSRSLLPSSVLMSSLAAGVASRLLHLNSTAVASLENSSGGTNPSPAQSSSSPSDNSQTESGDEDLLFGYQLPPKEIRDIVDAPPIPALSFSPHRDKILFLKRRSLPPLSELARPEEKLAGIRIDGSANSRSRLSFYTGIVIHSLLSDGTLGPEKEVHGFPDGSKINFVSWSTDGRHLAFSIRTDEEDNKCSKLRVWIADVDSGKAKPLFQSDDICLNAIFENFVWVDDSTLLVCSIPVNRGSPPKKPLVPASPKIQSNEKQKIVQVRTFQDLLKDEHDKDLFDYYAVTQLLLASDGKMKPIGPPALYTSVDPSPDGKYLLVSHIHRPYSFMVPCSRFPEKVDLWTADGEFIKEICDLPLAEHIPIAFNSVRRGKRSVNWRPDKPSTIYWVETQDGGDAKVEVSPRDIVYTQPAEFRNGEKPDILHKLDLRYGGISWCDDSLALVYESWYKTRRTKTWAISPGHKDVNPRILFDRSSEDVYSDPGSPMMRRTAEGTYVIAKIRNKDEGIYILLNGRGATPEGNVPFLDLFDIQEGKKERIWQSDREKYYESVVALMSDYNDDLLNIEQLKILTSKESKTENTQYFIQSWPDKKTIQITNFPHPYPQLAELQKEMVRYKRKDDVQLTATLYLPPGYSPSDGPLPCLVWSYPGEFKSKDAAGQVRGSPNEFAGIGSTSALLWLARRFAILSGPTIPIIGEGDEEANDRYVEQLVSSAEAAVEEVIRRGVAHPDKIAVGGHSYGAFMTANLLAHAPHLFCCGIARSGAYNRTLTPFGFQNEDRTLWESIDTYVNMSPFMSANKIKKPLLLIHGEEDNNSGTLTMQSDRFFNALKGHGTVSRLVILPFESHGYSARESIMHVLWETDRWLQKYCTDNSEKSEESHDSKTEAHKTLLSTAGLATTEAREDDESNPTTMKSLL
ncbi:probable glutamyl endopeptidase, chloroplastic [Phalaenopsis equestris]|uniref:probable glutamyl endopeptidase, chloroplastic n=1 Tax=Phalaenopsis equestris TaxID=78828 RepID=UPI0009E32E03|nr:probable glutamyl endopeptidase, chloroplastic [Phalaenopsis equestris]